MSFSSDIKLSLCKTEYECKDCRKAELSGFFDFAGRAEEDEIRFGTTLKEVRERILSALKAEFGIEPKRSERKYVITGGNAQRLREGLKADAENECCKTAYLRGAFLGGGSVSNPQKEYHLEIDTKSENEALRLMAVLDEFDFKPKKTQRKGKEVVYIKESSQIADLIGYMSCGTAGLEIISVQIEKELKSSTQRRVNCDSANLNKQAKASSRQIAAIKKIKAAHKWSALPEVLREIGELRMRYPDVSIEMLGKLTKQQIGKSGVNHRLNRIMEYADGLTGKGE